MVSFDVHGPVATVLPRPNGRYFSIGVLALIGLGTCLAVYQDRDHAVAIVGWAAAAALLIWVVLVRPMVNAYENGLQLTNMVRDVFIPWERIERVRALHVFRVVTDEGTFSCVGVGRSARSQIKSDDRYADRPTMAATMLGTSLTRMVGLGSRPDKGISLPEYVEQMVVREANERSRVRETRGEPPRPIRRDWAVDGVGALGLAVLSVVAALLA